MIAPSKIKSVRFLTWGKQYNEFYKPLMDAHRKMGHKVDLLWYNNWNLAKLQKANPDIVYFWNGEYSFLKRAKNWCSDNNIPSFCLELAWFPQGKSIYCDYHGTNGRCSLHFDDLSWLERDDYTRLFLKREEYRDGLSEWSGKYVLVPLQLTHDTTMQHWSPLKANAKVIATALRMFPDKKVVFRKHPKDKKKYHDLEREHNIKVDWEFGHSRPLKEMILGADLVWGMNSTVLSEAALMGKPVIAAGRSFLNIGQNREQALAAMVAREIPIDTEDVTPWTRRGRGLEHLSVNA